MKESFIWRWVGRIADVGGAVTTVIAAVSLAVLVSTTIRKQRRIVAAAGWEAAWLIGAGAVALVGLVVLSVGIRRRRDVWRVFSANRGRDSTAMMVLGSGLLMVAAASFALY